MSSRRALSVLLLASVASSPFAQGPLRTLRKGEFTGFEITGIRQQGYRASAIPENVVRSFRLDFHNGTPYEVQSVDVRYWTEIKGKTVFEKRGLTIERFHDYAFALDGSALPGHRAPGLTAFSVDYPSALWNVSSHDRFEVEAIHVFPDDANLHDAGHLYTWLRRSSDAEILAQLKADPTLATATFPSGVNALAVAFHASTVPVIQAMIASGAAFQPAYHVGDWDIPTLHMAASNDHLEPLAYLKERGMPIDAVNDAGHTALEVALSNGHVANARWLLKNGADPNHRDKDGQPPAYYAYNLPDTSIMATLRAYGANFGYHNRGMGLMQLAALDSGDPPIFLANLVKLGLSVDDSAPGIGTTPLMLAAAAQNNVAAIWLLGHGARLDAVDANGLDVLEYARTSNTLHSDFFFRRDVLAKLQRPAAPAKSPRKPKGKA